MPKYILSSFLTLFSSALKTEVADSTKTLINFYSNTHTRTYMDTVLY